MKAGSGSPKTGSSQASAVQAGTDRRAAAEHQRPDGGLASGPGPELPDTTLDDLLCFDVYAASRALTRAYRPLLDPLGLTYPQFLVMQSLWEAEATHDSEDRAPLTVGALGERLALDSGTLSPLLKRLERAGLVSRERSRHDEREVTVLLTSAGRALRDLARRVPSEITRLVALSAPERAQLQATLRRMRQHVEQ
ncbi:MarR family winged helix-turn-helix transcriptional regulator [Deinococcus sp.]|uniref:MarR family winged helix-turn-helix transcriptional regulator n=1 Tax=Deinococcus sp. TaxID=47478 RepID=UPI003C7A795A